MSFHAVIFNASGSIVAPDQTLLTSTYTPTSSIPTYDFRSIGNNEFLLTWSSPQAGGGTNDFSGNGVQGQLFVLTNAGDLVATGTSPGQTLIASSAGLNELQASPGGSTLVGGAGTNVLIGGTGNDTLIAGTGQNTLIGGSGNETFVVTAGANLSGIVIEGDGYANAPVAAGQTNTLELDNEGQDASFDFTQAGTISGITSIADLSTSGSVTATFDASQLTSLQSIALSGATDSVTIVDNTSNTTVGSPTATYTGWTGNDQLTVDASGTSGDVGIYSAPVPDETIIGGPGNNIYYLNAGQNVTVIGGIGTNTAVFPEDPSQYTIVQRGFRRGGCGGGGGSTTTIVTDNTTGAIYTLIGVQKLQFPQTFTSFGAPFVATSYQAGNQTEYGNASLGDGSSVMVYSSADLASAGDGTVIRLAHYTAGGSLAGPDILVSTASGDNQTLPIVRTLPNNELLAGWFDSTTDQYLARIYSQTGLTPITSQFQINQTSSPDLTGYTPTVALTSAGDLVFLWQASSGDGSGTAIYARVFNPDGTPAGNEFVLDTTTAGNQLRPRASGLEDGNTLVVFESTDGALGAGYDLRGIILSPSGTPIGSDFLINNTPAGNNQTRESLLLLGNGDTLVAWESGEGGTTNTRIRYRLLDANGNPIGTSDLLLNAEPAGTGNQEAPLVRSLPGGGAALVYENLSSDGTISFHAVIFDANGNITTPDQTLLTSTSYPANSVATYDFRSIGNNEFLLTWSSPQAGGGTNDSSGNGVQGQLFVLTNSGDLVATGTSPGQTLIASSSGLNELEASPGGSTLVGGAGTNVLIGGTGNDTLIAGSGQNTLIGGSGNETFVVTAGADLAGAVIEGDGYANAPVAAGQTNTLELNNEGQHASFDFTQASKVSGITNIADASTTGSVTATFDASQLTDLQSFALSGATETVTITDNTATTTIGSPTATYTGWTSNDQLTVDASMTSAPVAVFAAPVPNETILGGSGNNIFYLSPGESVTVDGGSGGYNIAVLPGSFSDYSFAPSGGATIATNTIDGSVATLSNIQLLEYAGDVSAPPSVLSATASPNGTETQGETIDLTLTFSEAVNVLGNLQLSLNTGGVATYASGSGTNTLTFTYTVGNSDTGTANLAITGIVPGATLSDAAQNAANLSGVTFGVPVEIPFETFGPTFTATSVTSGGQIGYSSAALPDGSSVLVYSSPDLSGSGDGTVIRLAHYNAGGTIAGPDILVSTASSHNQTLATARTLPDGNLVISWVDSTTGTLYSRIYNQDLTPLTSQFAVNQTSVASTSGFTPNIVPAVSSGSGEFLELWTAVNGTGTDVYGRFFNEDGTPAGNEFEISTTTGASQLRPRGSLLPDGNILVTFENYNAATASYSLLANIVNPGTGSVTGSDFQINTTSSGGDQTKEGLAQLGYGDTLVAWELGEGGTTNTRVRYTLLDANGNPIGTPDALLNPQPSGTGNQRSPIVRSLPNGGAVILYTTFTPGEIAFNAVIFNPDGTIATPNQTLLTSAYTSTTNSTSFSYDFRPIGNNEFLLTWSPNQSGETVDGVNGVEGQIFTLNYPGPPVVTSAAANPATGVEGDGQTINLSLTFNEAVFVSGALQLSLNDGGVASYTGGSGTSTLNFSYTVGSSDTGVSNLAITGVVPSSASVTDVLGNAADLSGADVTFAGLQISPAPTVIGAGETLTINNVASGFVISDGGTLQVGPGGSVSGVTVSNGGTLNVLSGGTATGAVIQSGGTETVYGTDINAIINDGGVQTVEAGGMATGTVVNDPGTQIVLAGGTANNVTLSGGVQALSGTAHSTLIGGGGIQNVEAGSTAIGSTVSAGGTENVQAGGSAAGVAFSGTGGTLTLSDASGLSGSISNFAQGDSIDFASASIQSAVVSNGTLTVTETSGQQVSYGISVSGNLAGQAITFSSDNSGGSSIVVASTPLAVNSISVSASDGLTDLGIGTTALISAGTTENAFVSGTPALQLSDGGQAVYVSGSGTNSLTFAYTVQPGQNTSDLTVAGLVPGSGTITDQAGNAIAGLANQDLHLQVDTLVPAITSVSTNPVLGDEGLGKAISITLTFNKAVTVTGSGLALTLNDGGVATYASGSGTNSLTFDYTVSQTDSSVPALAITGVTGGSSVSDAAGNTANFAGAVTVLGGLQVDTLTPSIISVTPAPATGL